MQVRIRGWIVGDEESAATVKAGSASVIEAIASATQRPFEEVKRVYEDEFARLKSSARITDYLVVLASRRTRAALARRR
jgi:hypothetical protein